MEANLIVVDDHDRPIGTKPRSALGNSDIHRGSALWVTNANGDVLLARRKQTKKDDPGRWGPAVGGTVEAGETYENNIYKEAAEEIGLTGYTFTKGPKVFYDQYHLFCQWHKVVVNKDIDAFMRQDEEVEELAWFPADQLRREIIEQPERFMLIAPQWIKLFL